MRYGMRQKGVQPWLGSRKGVLFRFLAVVVGLSPLFLFEGLFVYLDWGRRDLHDDPFVGFDSVQPLFVPSEDGARMEIARSRLTHFCKDSFSVDKRNNEFRVFCLGGSTVQGEPFGIETAFPAWLEIALRTAAPGRPFKVVNCGGVSYASYRLVPILEEVLQYQPDLVVVYEGHNEFLEQREYAPIERRGDYINGLLALASRARSFVLAREIVLRARGGSREMGRRRPMLPSEVEALLDYQGGLEAYQRDDDLRRGVIAHYRQSLRRMIEIAKAAKVDLILVNPVSNFADCPPFKSEHRANLTPAEKEEWNALHESANQSLRLGPPGVPKAIERLERACQLDPLHAGAFYNLAKCWERIGEYAKARAAYLRAKDLDVCPLRILQPMNDAVLDAARETNTPVVDAQRLFEEISAHGIVGAEWLVDHVHPNFAGHQLLADAIATKVVEIKGIDPPADWPTLRQRGYERWFATRDDYYFLRGESRLESLRGWTQGRATRLRSPGKTDLRGAKQGLSSSTVP